MPRQFRNRSLNAVGLALMGALLLPGCGGYGEISSEAYDYASALYSICNRHDESRLADFSARLEAAHNKGHVTSEEATWLTEIVDQARAGDWEDASADARRMMTDQVEDRS